MDNSPKRVARSLALPHLRQAREARGLGVRQLERRTDISRDTIIDLERGNRRAYRSTILKLAEALQTDPQTLTAHYWELSDMERKAFERLVESGRPQSFFIDEEEDDTKS